MSLFGRSAQPSPAVQQDAMMESASFEMEMVSDMFNRLVRSCSTKCIGNRYAEAELNKGESVCVDRCVDKFFRVNEKIGERLQAKGAAQQQQAAGGGGGGFFGR